MAGRGRREDPAADADNASYRVGAPGEVDPGDVDEHRSAGRVVPDERVAEVTRVRNVDGEAGGSHRSGVGNAVHRLQQGVRKPDMEPGDDATAALAVAPAGQGEREVRRPARAVPNDRGRRSRRGVREDVGPQGCLLHCRVGPGPVGAVADGHAEDRCPVPVVGVVRGIPLGTPPPPHRLLVHFPETVTGRPVIVTRWLPPSDRTTSTSAAFPVTTRGTTVPMSTVADQVASRSPAPRSSLPSRSAASTTNRAPSRVKVRPAPGAGSRPAVPHRSG